METTISGLLELAKIQSSQISEISLQIAKNSEQITKQGEQISEISIQVARQGEQITKQGEQISEISIQVARQGEQIAELAEDIQFIRDINYDIQTQISRTEARNERKFNRYQSDMDAMRRDFVQLIEVLQSNKVI
jgi:chromosome segregation ATPase